MKTIKQTVAKGKRLVVSDHKGIAKQEYHGNTTVDREVPDDWTWELLDEKPGPTVAEIEAMEARRDLAASGASMACVVEEVVMLLKAGDTKLAGLSKSANDKITAREALRQKL